MRLFRNMRVLWAVPVMLSSMPARADEGLPQLDVSLFPEQLFWLAVSFALLYVLMSMIALPRVAKTQGNRKEIIASEVEAARVASEAAKLSIATVEKSLAQARAKAQASVSEMMTEFTQGAAERQTKQDHELMRRLREAEADIAVAREAAMQSIAANANELASATIEKIIGSKVRVG